MVLAYCSPFLIAISSANRLWYLKHSLPIPPVVVKTKGVNVPCSMSRTLLEYRRFFFILVRTICCGSRSLYDSALGWQTLTSKNADRRCSQIPRAWISNFSSCALLDPLLNCSPEMSRRTGSVSTSLQTVLRSSASRSLSSL